MTMGQVQAVALYYMIKEGGHPLLNTKMSRYKGRSAGHPTQAWQTCLDFIRVIYTDDFPPTDVLPACTSLQIWAGVALLLPKSTQRGTLPASYCSPARRRSLPPRSPDLGPFPRDEAPQSQFMGLGQKPGLAESGSQRKVVPPRWGKAGLKYERAWS